MRRACEKRGHKWKAGSPSDYEVWCGRLFCRAKTKTQMGGFIDLIQRSFRRAALTTEADSAGGEGK